MILERFIKHITNIEYPKTKSSWNISGIFKKRSNEHLRYDVRPMSEINNMIAKEMSTASQADKLVFETANSWLVIDNKELKKYVTDKKLKIVYLDNIIKDVDTWVINKDEQ